MEQLPVPYAPRPAIRPVPGGPSGNATTLPRLAALCSAGAAAIHLGVTPEHFQQWWLYGVFFLTLAAFQLGWAAVTWQSCSRGLLRTGFAVNLATLGLWATTRTSGLPFGPDAGARETVGTSDALSGVLEGALIVLVALVLTGVGRHRVVSRGGTIGTLAVAGVAVLGLTGAALAAPTEHGRPAGDAAHATDGPHDGDSAAGDTTHGERHQLANLPDVSHATAAQTAAARHLLDRLKAGTERYRDVAVAEAAGYDLQAALQRVARKHPDAPDNRVIKLLHVANAKAVDDGKVADPTAPETLVYRRVTNGEWQLIGVLFKAPRGSKGPEVASPYARWHYHSQCVGADGKRSAMKEQGNCPDGAKPTAGKGYMMHIWLVSDADLSYAYAVSAPMKQINAYQQSLR